MTPEIRRIINGLESRLAQMERERRQYWAVPIVGGGTAAPPSLYVVTGGKALADWGADGGRRITSALSAASLPAGTGGASGDVVIMSANPVPAGLPDGIAVAARVADGAAVFVLADSSCSITSDLIQGDLVILSTSSNYDVSSGGVTYRYVCYKSLGRR